jgi:uncharacterized repeat protein (TIGR02543 family)
VTVLGNIGAPPLSKADHTFGGWNTAANGSGTTYQAAATFPMPASAVTLYAIWTPNSNPVIYHANGGTGDVPVDASSPYAPTITVTVLGNEGMPPLSKTNYIFDGWNTAANGSGTTYQDGETFSMPSSAVTLYAIWLLTYQITFDANGGVGGEVQTVAEGVIPTPPTVTRPGYIFQHWDPTIVAATANATYTAQWIANPPIVSADPTHVTCYGSGNGAIALSVSAGTAPFTFAWSNAATTQNLSGLTAGTYTVTVTDAASQTATTSATVTQPPQWWPTVTGSSPICSSVTGTYTTESGMTNYIWTVSAGGSIVSGGTSTDHTVSVSWGSAGAQSVSVNYTTPAGCTAFEAGVKPVTVHPAPAPVISGATVVPDGTTVDYSTPYVAGHTYSWSVNIGNVQFCDNTRTCMRVKWYNPCGLIGPGVVQVTETDPVTGCSTTATVYVTFTP